MGDKRNNQHEDIEDVVKDYQAGSEIAGEELLRIFGCHPDESVSKYVGKYFDLLRYGKVDFKNKDIRRFIALFVADSNVRKSLIPFYQYTDTKAAAMKVVERLVKRFEQVDDEDLLQDLRLILLQQAKRYENTGKANFCGYLYNSYRFAVLHYYKWLFEDLLHNERTELTADVESIDESADVEVLDEWFFEDRYFEGEEEELGFDWIHNKTATFPFNRLSVYERTVLFLYYEKGMTDKEVSEITGFHQDTMFTHRKKIKAKLQELLLSGAGND